MPYATPGRCVYCEQEGSRWAQFRWGKAPACDGCTTEHEGERFEFGPVRRMVYRLVDKKVIVEEVP